MNNRNQMCAQQPSSSNDTGATNGDPAPLFHASAVIDHSIKPVKLEDYLGKWIVLFFYPSDFTFV